MRVTYKITIVATWNDDDETPSGSQLLDVFTDQAAGMLVEYLSCDEPTIRDSDGVTIEEIEPPGEE